MDRALDDPDRFVCTIYDDIGAAVLAVSLMAHPDYTTRTLQALGWIPDGCDGYTGKSPDMPIRMQCGTAIR